MMEEDQEFLAELGFMPVNLECAFKHGNGYLRGSVCLYISDKCWLLGLHNSAHICEKFKAGTLKKSLILSLRKLRIRKIKELEEAAETLRYFPNF